MIKLSEQTVTFVEHQKQKQLYLKNLSASVLLFKIKSNKIEAIDAFPNFGAIDSGHQIKIVFKIPNEKNVEQLKILIKYSICEEKYDRQDFHGLWKKYSKATHNILLPVLHEQSQKQQFSDGIRIESDNKVEEKQKQIDSKKKIQSEEVKVSANLDSNTREKGSSNIKMCLIFTIILVGVFILGYLAGSYNSTKEL